VEISKSVARGVSQIQNMSTRTVARTGGKGRMALKAKQAQSGMKQVETPENATRKFKDASNARTSAMNRDINSWQKSGFKAFPKQKKF
jgi:hypothetical protein